MENSTPCKFKTVKDIQKPAGIYHYGASRSRVVLENITEIGLPIFGGQKIGDVLVCLFTNTQTNSFASHTGHNYMEWPQRLNAQNTCLLGVSKMTNHA